MELKTLGRNIRKARQAKGLTQENTANDLGCSLNTYTKIERGETNVPFLRLVQIAKYLDIPLSDLVRENADYDIKGMATDIALIRHELQTIKIMLER
ncbi:MAG: helix-turn-helix domain-containing protein [Candidatus Aphodosoma sp.]